MERSARIFRSFDAAGAADDAYYGALTPQERLAILLALIEQGLPDNEAQQRLERVYRIVELARS